VNEFELIARYFSRPPRDTGFVAQAGGDDCALLNLGDRQLAVTTDLLVEGRHFLPEVDPAALGHKALAVNLSDLAAAGATPRCFFLALALPRLEPEWLDAFSAGLYALADAHDCVLAGGDTTRAAPVAQGEGPRTFCITAVGEVPVGQAHGRGGARPGDELWVSGSLGDAALALAHLLGEVALTAGHGAGCAARAAAAALRAGGRRRLRAPVHRAAAAPGAGARRRAGCRRGGQPHRPRARGPGRAPPGRRRATARGTVAGVRSLRCRSVDRGFWLMSPPGRPKGESPSAQREGSPMSPPGGPEGESSRAHREGSSVSPLSHPEVESPSAPREGSPMSTSPLPSPPALDPAPARATAHSPQPSRRPTWRLLLSHPAHMLSLGFGSGLPRQAPGTFGTLAGWLLFVWLDQWLGTGAWFALIGASFLLGAWAAQVTGRRLGGDSGHIVIDEIVAFWLVLLLLPADAGPITQAIAFLLFRLFDIAKPPPIGLLDARIDNGLGVMLDDLVAAFYTLLVLAIALRVAG